MSAQIRAYVDRIIRLKEEARDINRDVREIYAEAKATGHDKTILGKLVNYIEKRNDDSNAVAESEALFELYLSAYDGVGTVRATHTHEAISSPVNDSGQGEADGAFRPGNHTSVSSAPISEPVSAPSTADADDRDAPLASSSTAGVSVVNNVTVPRPEGCQSPNACGSSSWRKLCHSCQRAWDAEHGHTSGDAA